MEVKDVMFPNTAGKLEITTTDSFLEKLKAMADGEGVTVADIVRKSVEQYSNRRKALDALAHIGQQCEDYSDDYGPTVRS